MSILKQPLILLSKLGRFRLNNNDTMFNNSFVYQYIFNYFESNNNENDKMLDLNVMINVNVKIIAFVIEFGDSYEFTFVASHDSELNYKYMHRGPDLEIG